MSMPIKQHGYWKTDGQVKWFVKFKIPLTRDLAWTFDGEPPTVAYLKGFGPELDGQKVVIHYV